MNTFKVFLINSDFIVELRPLEAGFLDDLCFLDDSHIVAQVVIFYAHTQLFILIIIILVWTSLFITGNLITSKVDTVTFRKDTAGNTTLNASSCHPLHTVKAVPMGELTRVKRNCSSVESFEDERMNVCNKLKERGYPQWMLNRATNCVAHTDRKHLLRDKPHKIYWYC